MRLFIFVVLISSAILLQFRTFAAIEGRKNTQSQSKVELRTQEVPPDAVVQGEAYAHFIKATLYEKNGQLDEALAEYKKALKLDPDTPLIYQKMGGVELKRQNFEVGVQYLEKALELDPKLIEAHLLLGTVFYTLKKTDRAISEYQIATKLDPENTSTYLTLAEMLVREKKIKEAIDIYQKVVKADINSSILGVIWFKLFP